MDRSTFEPSEPILDEIAANFDELLDSDQFSAVRNALARLSEAIGHGYSVNLNVCVEVFDSERTNPLPLLNMGLSTSRVSLLTRLIVTPLPRSTWSMARSRWSLTTIVPSATESGISSWITRLVRRAVQRWEERSSCFSTPMSAHSASRGRSR